MKIQNTGDLEQQQKLNPNNSNNKKNHQSVIEENSTSSNSTAITNDYELPTSIINNIGDIPKKYLSSDLNSQSNIDYKVYKIRHFLLLIFITLSMTNAFHWIEYAIIETIVCDYYQVSTFWVNCTSVVYMFSYIIGIIPATFLQDRYGLRTCLIIGSFGNVLGSWIKCISVARSRFWVAMFGQTLTAFAQLFILNIPPMLAATWFPLNEVTRATAYGVFGNQVGIALGFLVPPLLMPQLQGKNNTTGSDGRIINESIIASSNVDLNEEQLQHIERGFTLLSLALSIITSIIFLLILIFFKNRPKHPPSRAQALVRDLETSQTKKPYFESIKELIKNANFDLLFISYGLNTGIFYALSTVLSQMITRVMGEQYLLEAGYMGLSITLAGIIGSVVCGYILGWSRKFKLVNLVIYIFSLLGTAAFTVAIQVKSVQLLFVTCSLLGFFMTGYLPIGFEFAAEISYPQPEGTSAGLLNASAQIFGIIFTYASTPIIDHFGSVWTNIGYLIVLTIGVILTMLVKNDLRRQNAHIHRTSLHHRSITSICMGTE